MIEAEIAVSLGDELRFTNAFMAALIGRRQEKGQSRAIVADQVVAAFDGHPVFVSIHGSDFDRIRQGKPRLAKVKISFCVRGLLQNKIARLRVEEDVIGIFPFDKEIISSFEVSNFVFAGRFLTRIDKGILGPGEPVVTRPAAGIHIEVLKDHKVSRPAAHAWLEIFGFTNEIDTIPIADDLWVIGKGLVDIVHISAGHEQDGGGRDNQARCQEAGGKGLSNDAWPVRLR